MNDSPKDPKLEKLTGLLEWVNSVGVSKREFVEAFAEVVKYVKNLKQTSMTEFQKIHEFMTKKMDKMQSEMSASMSSAEKKMMKSCKDEMERMDKVMMKRMSEVKDGKDADEMRIIAEVLATVPPPPFLTSVEIKERLEILTGDERLSIDAIKDLRKELDELRKMKNSTIIGSGGFNYGSIDLHMIDDETPVGDKNGVNTDFVLNHIPNPATSLKVYRGGARQRLTEDYTFSGQTITFINPPAEGEIILCDYRA